jgi:probable O-glycosylation ligase (exosortase A-associated)
VFGPPESFFSENNELALALNMCIPILVYLAREETRRWLRGLLWAAFGLSALSVPFTYSRGGFLGLVTVLAFLFLKARKRWIVLPLGAAALVGFMLFAPAQWFSRVQTLEDYQADESAQRRLLAWRIAYEIAVDHPVTGGGFRVMTYRETYLMYVPDFARAIGHDAHSIYFNLLAEHGWIGLGLFGLLVGFSLLSLMRLKRQGAKAPGAEWIARYADMLYVSLIGYLVNGAFLSVAYFDLAYQLLILVPVLRALAATEFARLASAPKEILPVPRPARPVSRVS